MLLLVNIGPLNLLQCNYTVDVPDKGYAIKDFYRKRMGRLFQQWALMQKFAVIPIFC